jgi:hypothetical protein
MAIKYVCDFCGQEAKNFHKEFTTSEIVCDDCYDHLKKQTWRLAEEPRELEKAKEVIRQESKRLTSQREEFLKEQEMDRRLAARYQKGFHALVQLYNQMVEALDSILPNGFLFNKRKPFRTISEEEVNLQEGQAISEVVQQVERNFHYNFDNYFEKDPLCDKETYLPTVHLPWDKDN